MRRYRFPVPLSVLLSCVCAAALFVGQTAAKEPLLLDPAGLKLADMLPSPPAQNSATVKAELQELHQIEQSRTPAQVAAAQADEKQQNIFYLHTVMGDEFTAANLPLTAALSERVEREEPAATNPIKGLYLRPRPYQFDATLHPVCGTTIIPNSYPSGHGTVGYLEALLLLQMVPEKREAILARADDYAHNRLVCGVHYPSDIAASRSLAYAVFGALLETPEFEKDVVAARDETRKKLGLK